MGIKDLKDKEKVAEISVKIIWDQSKLQEMFGKKIKSVLVADIDSQPGDPTAYLDLYNEDIDNFKFQDKIKIINAYSKLIKNDKGQFRITNAQKIVRIQ